VWAATISALAGAHDAAVQMIDLSIAHRARILSLLAGSNQTGSSPQAQTAARRRVPRRA